MTHTESNKCRTRAWHNHTE